jgi:hypothetical protein
MKTKTIGAVLGIVLALSIVTGFALTSGTHSTATSKSTTTTTFTYAFSETCGKVTGSTGAIVLIQNRSGQNATLTKTTLTQGQATYTNTTTLTIVPNGAVRVFVSGVTQGGAYNITLTVTGGTWQYQGNTQVYQSGPYGPYAVVC